MASIKINVNSIAKIHSEPKRDEFNSTMIELDNGHWILVDSNYAVSIGFDKDDNPVMFIET